MYLDSYVDLRIVEYALSRILAVECKEKLRNCEDDIFIEEIEDHLCYSDIIESPMVEHQFPQTLELPDGIITRLNCPHSLLTVNSYSNMSLLDHVYIVSSISDG